MNLNKHRQIPIALVTLCFTACDQLPTPAATNAGTSDDCEITYLLEQVQSFEGDSTTDPLLTKTRFEIDANGELISFIEWPAANYVWTLQIAGNEYRFQTTGSRYEGVGLIRESDHRLIQISANRYNEVARMSDAMAGSPYRVTCLFGTL